MYTLLQLYDYLNLGDVPSISGSFQEPSAGPGPTMKTTTNIYDDTKAKFDQCRCAGLRCGSRKKFFSTQDSSWGVQTGTGGGGSSAAVPKTGQTTSDAAGDDGDLQKGVAWPSPRFTANIDGTVTDNLTGLMWILDSTSSGIKTWANALTYCNALIFPADGHDDWRLPNIRELYSLVDLSQSSPALPPGHPFTVNNTGYYWSSTDLRR
ncbi:MAG: DUF1566 domain-containing protein [Deltaproteobacteria bacterium]|nr:DUF1566 domain-containing protein [Deltaproteobacteria bacterium]